MTGCPLAPKARLCGWWFRLSEQALLRDEAPCPLQTHLYGKFSAEQQRIVQHQQDQRLVRAVRHISRRENTAEEAKYAPWDWQDAHQGQKWRVIRTSATIHLLFLHNLPHWAGGVVGESRRL